MMTSLSMHGLHCDETRSYPTRQREHKSPVVPLTHVTFVLGLYWQSAGNGHVANKFSSGPYSTGTFQKPGCGYMLDNDGWMSELQTAPLAEQKIVSKTSNKTNKNNKNKSSSSNNNNNTLTRDNECIRVSLDPSENHSGTCRACNLGEADNQDGRNLYFVCSVRVHLPDLHMIDIHQDLCLLKFSHFHNLRNLFFVCSVMVDWFILHFK